MKSFPQNEIQIFTILSLQPHTPSIQILNGYISIDINTAHAADDINDIVSMFN